MESTVESLCNQLARHRLLDGDAIRVLHGKWKAAAGAAAGNLVEFRKWLVRTGNLSGFQLDMLERGHGDFLNFGDYQLQQRIGTGRMTGVYKAVHRLGQTVAIKVLPPSKSKHTQILGRFLREARLAVKLDHDNVVRTFQSGLHKDMYYLVMEFLDGETLEETLLRRKRLPLNEAVPILLQALQGLNHLHEIGVVHRDLKPGNLMLVPGENAGAGDTTLNATVKILDIGLGRALFDEGTPGTEEAGDITSDGVILGTLSYMAPEQARDAHGADIRADIYSLGCVMYEMLTGRPPFTDTNFARQLRQHAEDKPKPIPELVPAIPPPVDHVVQKMLAKDPALRYATPHQVLRDVKSLAVPPPLAKPVRPMRSYLSWLDSQPREAVPAALAPPQQAVAEPSSLPTAIMANPFTNLASPAPAFMAPVPAAPLPQAVPVAPVRLAAPAGKTVPLPALTAPALATPHPVDNGLDKFAKKAWHGTHAFGWGKRDWLVAALGAGAVLAVQLVIWIARKLFG